MTDNNNENENAPEIVLRDGALRSATWREDGEYGPMFNTRITKLYRDDEGQPRETSTLSSKDLLRAAELARETHYEVLERQRAHALERKAERGSEKDQNTDFFDEDMSRADIKRERFKGERSQGTRRSPKRERSAR